MGFERQVTITFCDLSIFLHTPQLTCKADKSYPLHGDTVQDSSLTLNFIVDF